MSYIIQIMSPVSRTATIAGKLGASTPTREFYGFRNRKSDLPFIQVPIELPVYRMANFRTFTDQSDYLSSEEKPENYFSAGQESEEAQQSQHGLLYRLAEKGKSDSIVPVSIVLEKEGQRQPLLITANGVVVNGNRRLAAMREIFESDRTKYAAFSHIDVLVLPSDATAEEIVDIEANLQAMPETKLDYDWIGEAQLIKTLVGLGRTYEQVGNQLNRKDKDISYAIQTLAEADLYLKDSLGTEGAYSEIREDAEQLFRDLPKLIEGKSEIKKQASRVIAWTLFQNKEKLPSRLYDYNAAIGKLADDVLDRVAEELGIDTQRSDAPQQSDDVGDFDVSLDDEPGVADFQPVIDALMDEDGEEAIDSLIEAAVAVVELQRGQKSGRATLKTITQAHSKLAAADLSKASKETLPMIAKQLTEIRRLVDKMDGQLNKATAPSKAK